MAKRKVYNDATWRAHSRALRREQPFCVICEQRGISTLATEVHHLEIVGNDKEKLWKVPTINVCSPCHSVLTGLERRGINPNAKVPPPKKTDCDGVPTCLLYTSPSPRD